MKSLLTNRSFPPEKTAVCFLIVWCVSVEHRPDSGRGSDLAERTFIRSELSAGYGKFTSGFEAAVLLLDAG